MQFLTKILKHSRSITKTSNVLAQQYCNSWPLQYLKIVLFVLLPQAIYLYFTQLSESISSQNVFQNIWAVLILVGWPNVLEESLHYGSKTVHVENASRFEILLVHMSYIPSRIQPLWTFVNFFPVAKYVLLYSIKLGLFDRIFSQTFRVFAFCTYGSWCMLIGLMLFCKSEKRLFKKRTI